MGYTGSSKHKKLDLQSGTQKFHLCTYNKATDNTNLLESLFPV